METIEIFKEVALSYDELVEYLLKKYGPAIADYFHTESCKSKNKKISRTNEGLFCHHIDEDKAGNLSGPVSAARQPYRWQKKDRLVYCNYIEHLILHIKIAILRQKTRLYSPEDYRKFFSTGGIDMICKTINDAFVQEASAVKWRQVCIDQIRENKKDYILLLRALFYYLDKQYAGTKSGDFYIKAGSQVFFYDTSGEIIKVSQNKQKILVKLENGEEHSFFSSIFDEKFTYKDIVDLKLRDLSSGFKEFYESFYLELLKQEDQSVSVQYYPLLVNGFHGYGFPQFTDILLDDSFGALNVDQYLSKAYPSTVGSRDPINNTEPIFWHGNIPQEVETKGYYYIIRIEAAFDIKAGNQPFVRYKEIDILRSTFLAPPTDENNFLTRQGIILANSNIVDRKTGIEYKRYRNIDGEIVDATVKLTLTKDDFDIFRKRYQIRKLKYIDGCYFTN